MSSIVIGLLTASGTFAGALLGMGLQRLLPAHHLSDEMQDLVKLSAGTIATLTALVLGLLVSSAKSSFDAINTGIVQGSVKFILLDRALARCGPEMKPAREQLKRNLAGDIELVWPTRKAVTPALNAIERVKGLDLIQDMLRGVTPQNNEQRQAFAQVQQLMGDIDQARWLLIEQAQNQLPLPLLLILVFWLVLLFVSFGLFAPRNVTALIVLFVGACAISAAIFLVLELNRPLDGIIKVSKAPMQNALRLLNP